MSAQIVEYVLQIDAKSAERSLKSIATSTDRTADNVQKMDKNNKRATSSIRAVGSEAKQTSGAFEDMAASANKAGGAVDTMNSKTTNMTQGARNFRRAGRDLDGAFGDLGQGLKLVNPQLGNFAIRISDAASISEGIGRSLTALTNPAFLATAVLIGGLLGAIELFKRTLGETKKAEEALAKSVEESNEKIKEQQEAVKSARDELDDLTLTLQAAKVETKVITGEITSQEMQEFKLRDAIEKRKTAQLANTEKIRQGLIAERDEIIKIRDIKREQTGKFMNDEIRALIDRHHQINLELKTLKEQEKQITKNANKTADRLVSNMKLRERRKQQEKDLNDLEKKREKNAKSRAKAEAQALKEHERALKIIRQGFSAEEDLQITILKLTEGVEAQRALINAELEQEVDGLKELVGLGVDLGLVVEAELALREKAKRDIEELAKKEEERRKEIAKTNDEIAKARGEAIGGAIGSVSTIVQNPVEGVLTVASQAMAASGATIGGAAAGPISMAIVEAIGALRSISAKTPEEIEAEAIATTDAIITGIEILPELLSNTLPRIINDATFKFALLITRLPGLIIDAIIAGISDRLQALKSIFSMENVGKSIGDEIKNGLSFMARAFDPEQRVFMGGGRMTSAQGGVRFTGSSRGLAMLHEGEFVVPQSGQRPQAVDRQMNSTNNSTVININGTLIERNAVDALVRKLERRFGSFGQGQTSLFGR